MSALRVMPTPTVGRWLATYLFPLVSPSERVDRNAPFLEGQDMHANNGEDGTSE